MAFYLLHNYMDFIEMQVKKFKKKIYLGLVVGVSMFGFMAHTKQVTADTNQKERIMSQLDDSQISMYPMS